MAYEDLGEVIVMDVEPLATLTPRKPPKPIIPKVDWVRHCGVIILDVLKHHPHWREQSKGDENQRARDMLQEMGVRIPYYPLDSEPPPTWQASPEEWTQYNTGLQMVWYWVCQYVLQFGRTETVKVPTPAPATVKKAPKKPSAQRSLFGDD